MKKRLFCIGMAIVVISGLLSGCKSSDNVSSLTTPAADSSAVLTTSEKSTSSSQQESVQYLDHSAIKGYYDTIRSIDKKKDKVVAKVNGKPLYASKITESKARLNLTIDDNLTRVPEWSEKEKQEYRKKYSKTEEQLLNELVRLEVVRQTAVERGISFSEEEIYNQAKHDADSLKKDPYLYKMTLKAYDMSEEEYVRNYMKDVELRAFNNSVRKQFVESNGYGNETNEEIDPKYQKYVDDLVKQANVEYLNK